MTTIRHRRDTAANWTSVNPVLALGEPGLETDTQKFKYGDGSTAWTGLPYFTVTDALLSTSDVTSNNATSTKHGFVPKTPNDATEFLNGAGTAAYAAVKDSDLALTDVTSNNVSTSKHGFAPKAPNDALKYLDGTGNYTIPGGTGNVGTTGSPTTGNLAAFSSSIDITNVDLIGDVTTSGDNDTTIASIVGTSVGGTTGSGNVVFSVSPSLTTPDLGTPTALTLTSATGLPLTGLAAQAANTFVANNTSGSASPAAISLGASELAGRGASGDIAAISLGSGLSMTGAVLSASGGSGFTTIVKQKFTSSGTYTPTASMKYCIVEMCGGGGGGGGAKGGAAVTTAGGGGCAGEVSRKIISAATIGASQSVTIGAAGTGGASSGADGTDGGNTSLGALFGASGGGKGRGSTTTTPGNPGFGATSFDTSGDFYFDGGQGTTGVGSSLVTISPLGGSGGCGPYGNGGTSSGIAPAGGADGNPANNGYGGGGGGAGSGNTTGQAGGAGAPGVVFITEFI